MGVTLALMELRICLAHIFERRKVELFNIIIKNVDFIHGFLKRESKRAMKGVCIFVK